MADPVETRDRLVTVAQRQFSHYGYRGASVKSVAAEAGVTSGAVYHHFGSKEGMYSAVGTDVVGGIEHEYDQIVAGLGANPNQRERIMALFDTVAHQLVSRPDQARNGISVELDAARYEVAAAARDQWARALDQVYSKATQDDIETRDGNWWDFTKSTLVVEVLMLGISRYVVLHGTDDLDVMFRGVRRLLFANLEDDALQPASDRP